MFLSAHILSDKLDEKDSVEINHVHVSASVVNLASPPPIGLGSVLDLSQAVFAVLSDGTCSLEHVCVIRLKHSLPG